MVDETGQQLGVMDLRKALELSMQKGLDLIQVTDKVEPPVCKLGEYGKFLYEMEKKERASSKKQVKIEHKTIQLRYNTSIHDLETKANQTVKFLSKSYKVTVLLVLRGRERAFANLGKGQIDKFLEIVKAQIPIKIDQEIQKRPNGFSIIISQGKQ